MGVTSTIEQEIAGTLEGTCMTESALREKLDLTLTDEKILEIALNHNIESCDCCGWWMESGELVPDEDESPDLIGVCQDCRGSLK